MKKSRAFFPAIHYEYDNSLFVFGGRNKDGDVAECEKYSINMNKWVFIKNLPTSRNGSSAVIIDQYIFVIGGNSENIGQLDTIEQYFINYDKWDTIRLKLANKVSDFQVYPLFNWSGNPGKDYRVLVLGGNSEDERGPAMEIVDLKPYIYESAEDRVMHLLNNHYRSTLKDPMYGTMVQYGEANVAIVKRYCDLEPTADNIIILNFNSLAAS